MSDYVEVFRARAREARERYDEVVRTRGERLPAASPTTFADCAALYVKAAEAYGTASALGAMGQDAAAAGWNAQGHVLEDAAASCDASASGEIIEV